MPVSAQEHRVRTGLYSSCKGVWLSRQKFKHVPPTTKTRSNEETECDTFDLRVMWFLTTVILLVPLMYTTTMISIMALEVLLQINIFASGCASTVHDVSHQAKVDLSWLINVYHLVIKICSWLVQHRRMVTLFSLLCVFLISTVTAVVCLIIRHRYKQTVHRVVIVLQGEKIVDVQNVSTGHSSQRLMCVSYLVAILTAIIISLMLIKSGDVELNPGPVTVLTIDSHLLPIKDALWEARSHWKEIGRRLGLTDRDVNDIHEVYDGECLHQVLSVWIQTGRATIHDLLAVLEHKTVNQKDIADEIRALRGKERRDVGLDTDEETKQSEVQGKRSDMFQMDEMTSLSLLSSTESQTNRSPLEAPPLTNRPSVSVTNSTTAPTVSECNPSTRQPHTTELPTLSFTRDFQMVYETLHPARPKWYNLGLALKLSPPDLESIDRDNRGITDDCFRGILLTRMKKLPKLTWREIIEALRQPSVGERKLALRIEREYYHNGTENIEDPSPEQVFLPIIDKSSKESRLTILMDGAPGVGKTTITRKVCIDWANGEILQEYQLVIFVPLREVNLGQTEHQIADLLPPQNSKVKDQVIEYITGLKISGVNVLFIFDGFDELSTEQRTRQSLFLDIIKRNTLHHCSVLVTSRSYASLDLRCLNRINRHIEVLGFSEEQIRDCIINYQNLPREERNQLIRKLKERLDIQSLCYIPLITRIVLYVYRYGREYKLPSTLTQLYELFLLHTIKHHASAEKITSDVTIIEEIKEACSISELPQFVQTQLDSLSKLAFISMAKEKLIFTSKELSKPNVELSLGLLNALPCFTTAGFMKYYQFLHLTIQEFLAARHLMSDKNKTKFLKTNMDNKKFRMTLLFLAGLSHFSFLSSEKSLLGERTLDLSSSEGKDFFLFLAQLVFESQTSIKIMSTLITKLDLSGRRLTQFDCLVVAHFLSTTPQDHVWEVINLSNCGLSTHSILNFFSKEHVTTLDISDNFFRSEGLSALRELLDHNKSIVVLKAKHCHLSDKVLKCISKYLSHESSLRELDISLNGQIKCGSWELFFKDLQNNTSLRNLNINLTYNSSTIDPSRSVSALSEMITRNKGISELTIDMGTGCLQELLARALLRNTTLQLLRVTSFDDKRRLDNEIKRLRQEEGIVVSPDWNLKIVYDRSL